MGRIENKYGLRRTLLLQYPHGLQYGVRMRQKAAPPKKFKGRGVSLPTELWPRAFERADKLDITFSKYVKRLIQVDLERSILKP